MDQYSASMVSCQFWLQESKKTAELIVQGKTLPEIRKIATEENLYQVRAADRTTRIAGVTYKRVSALGNTLISTFLSTDIASSKILLLLAIMRTDLLFFEFMHTSFRQSVILGEQVLSDRTLATFFDSKIASSPEVAAFSDSAVKKLKQTYIRVLAEGGVLDSTKERTILLPMIDYRLHDQIRVEGLLPYLSTLTGDDANE